MPVRNATYHDAPGIKFLLETLGYTARLSLLVDQLETSFGREDHQVFVCETKKNIVGFASVHFLPQLAFDGGVLIISYFSVDPTAEHSGIAKELEQYIAEQARLHHCERIHVHCMDSRIKDHRFYLQQNYQEYPKYFTKRLIYGE